MLLVLRKFGELPIQVAQKGGRSIDILCYRHVVQLLAVGSYQGDAVMAWAGAGAIVLEEASKVEGPYTEVAGATNPFRVPTAGAQAKFYRAVRR